MLPRPDAERFSMEELDEGTAASTRLGDCSVRVALLPAENCPRGSSGRNWITTKRPFMQAAHDPELDNEYKSAAILALEIPSGNNHIIL